jgi:antitoxin PrlF
MESTGTIASKGRSRFPSVFAMRSSLHEGDQLLFRVERSRAVIAKTPNLLEPAGSVPVPAEKRRTPWDEVLHRTRTARALRRH